MDDLQGFLQMIEVGLFTGLVEPGDAGQMPFQFSDLLLGEGVGDLPQFPFEGQEQRVDPLVEKNSILRRQLGNFARMLFKLLENLQHGFLFSLRNGLASCGLCLAVAGSCEGVLPATQA